MKEGDQGPSLPIFANEQLFAAVNANQLADDIASLDTARCAQRVSVDCGTEQSERGGLVGKGKSGWRLPIIANSRTWVGFPVVCLPQCLHVRIATFKVAVVILHKARKRCFQGGDF